MNSVVLIGRLTRDPDLRYAAGSQTAVARFTLAVNRPFSKNNEADFINIVTFGKSAENCGRYITKGRMVAVQGRIQTGSYEKEGRKIYTTDVIADRVEFIGIQSDSNESNSNSNASNTSNSNYVPNIPEGFYEIDDDDEESIPF